ncbi:MAG: hypothetical protein GXY43_03615 [Clostridiaceae bacterium]|nr:hypothetical protein [Clostridiaceae bacterium]
MSENLADEYLNDICGGIPARETMEEVRSEFLDHLENRISDYLGSGYDREVAEKKAVEDMGEREQVREQLSHLHRRIPYIDMKNSLTQIILGLFLQFFNLDIGPLSAITTAIGLCFLFAGVFQLRKINRNFKKAWIASIIMITYTLLANVIWNSPLFYFGSEEEWITNVFGLIGGLFLFVLLSYLGRGLAELISRPAASSDIGSKDSPVDRETEKIRKIGGLYLIAHIVAMSSILIPGAGLFALLPFIILLSVILLRLIRVRGILLGRQLGYGVIDPGKKVWVGFWISGIVYVLLPFLIGGVLFILPRSFWYGERVIRENRSETEIENEVADSERVLADVDPYIQEILQLLPAEETGSINTSIEHKDYRWLSTFFQGDGIDASSFLCRQEDQTVLQVVCFSILDGSRHGGWDSILIPESAFPPADPERTSRVYIYTEDISGRIFEQRPIAIRYGDRTILSEDRSVWDVVCVDYAVKKQGCRQWVFICSTLIDDDGHGNRYMIDDENPINSTVHLDPLAGYVYIRRSSWFPHSYNDSVKRVEYSAGMMDSSEEIGYFKVFMNTWDSQMRYNQEGFGWRS